MSEGNLETRQGRREKKIKKKRQHMPQHGKNLARMYMDAILKRLGGIRAKSKQ